MHHNGFYKLPLLTINNKATITKIAILFFFEWSIIEILTNKSQVISRLQKALARTEHSSTQSGSKNLKEYP